MEIHAPDGPTHSFKDFAIHIGIVTIGILIALGLEGARETWREHTALVETRESFHRELEINRNILKLELARATRIAGELDKVIPALPALAARPPDLAARVQKIKPAGYFFKTDAWDKAMAAGTLAHMNADEVSRYSNYYLTIRSYLEVQKGVYPVSVETDAWFSSHHSYTPSELAAGEEKLRIYQAGAHAMTQVGDELADAMERALNPRTAGSK
jgi:hypothetical protein